MSLKEKIKSYPAWYLATLALLVLVPLPFGSNRFWASNLMGLLSGALLLWMLWADRDAPPLAGTPPRKRLLAAAALLSAVVAWAFAQTLSFMPSAWHHPFWNEAAGLLGKDLKGSISIDPGAFPEALVRLLSYVAFFLLAFFGGRNRESAALTVKTLGFAGLAYAAYGLIIQSTGSDTILWYKKWAYQGFLTSTFVNKNSYAAYAGFGLLCSLTLAWQRLKHVRIKDRVLAHTSRVAAWFASITMKDYLILLPPAVLLAALILTGSRAGLACSIFGSFTLLVAVAANRRWSAKKWGLLIGAGAALLLLFVAIGGDVLLSRLEDQKVGEDSATRMAAYALEEQAILDNPWLGFGLGSFEGAFRLYRDASLPLWFHRAHNDYLEMTMDLGLPAALALFTAIGLLVSCCATGVWRRKKDAVYPALALAATVLIGTHVLVDFSLHIPAVAATYAALLGLGVAQSFSTRESDAPTQTATVRPAVAAAEPARPKPQQRSGNPAKKRQGGKGRSKR